ncbi:MAG: GNAT family N-acetyltransferase [Gemmatimonadaceae bacterium]
MTSFDIVAQPDAPPGWDELALGEGSFYHRPAWVDGLARCYGFPKFYLAAHRGGVCVAGLALAEVPALLGPRRLVSLPFSYASGVFPAGSDATASLGARAIELATARSVRRLEIKQVGVLGTITPGFERVSKYSTYRVSTEGGEAVLWKRLHGSSTQRSIKKARRSGLEAQRGESACDWSIMADLEERTARRLGLPAPPRHFFGVLCVELQRLGLAELYLARRADGEVAAGITVWKGAREWIYAFGASRPEMLDLRPNHLLIWRAMLDAAAAGVTFDLGRAAPEQQGLVEFKKRWGAEAIPISTDFWPRAGGLNVARRDRGPLALATTVWSRLPLGVTRRAGGFYRYLG